MMSVPFLEPRNYLYVKKHFPYPFLEPRNYLYVKKHFPYQKCNQRISVLV